MPLSTETTSSSTLSVNRWLILATVSVGTFMSTLDSSIANVALPTMVTELNAPIHLIQWVLTAYLLTICALLPIAGKIADKLGKSQIYNYGFLIFTLGSSLCALSSSLIALILSRIIQAVGAACLMSCSQGIVAETFARGGRGKALGIIGTVVSLGSLTGPALGGILLSSLGWSAIFWINVPIGLLGFIAGLFLLPKDIPTKKESSFDYIGSGLFITGIVVLLYILSVGADVGWTSLWLWLGLIFAFVVLGGFYIWEQKTQHPMLDFSLYRVQAFALGNITALLSFVAMFFINVMMPFYMQNVLHYSPQTTGYAMMIMPLTMALVAPLSGWLSDRIGYRLLTTAGLSISALAFAFLNTLTVNSDFKTLALHLALFGLGSGLFQSPNNSSIMGAVPGPKLGSAGGLNALVRNIGMVLGTALSVAVYSRVLSSHGQKEAASPSAILNALHAVYWTALGICLAALIISSLRLKTHTEKQAS